MAAAAVLPERWGTSAYTSSLVPQCPQIKQDLFVLLALVALCGLAQVAPGWSSPDPLTPRCIQIMLFLERNLCL